MIQVKTQSIDYKCSWEYVVGIAFNDIQEDNVKDGDHVLNRL